MPDKNKSRNFSHVPEPVQLFSFAFYRLKILKKGMEANKKARLWRAFQC
jgi:hypothetical protein